MITCETQLWNFVKRALNQNTNPNAVLQTRCLNASYTMECNHSFLIILYIGSTEFKETSLWKVSTISFQPSVDIKSQSYRKVMEHFFCQCVQSCIVEKRGFLRWPTTVTSNTNYSHQMQITHIKNKVLTSNTNCSHQKQIAHIKNKLLTSNTNYSHQIQNPDIKNKMWLQKR